MNMFVLLVASSAQWLAVGALTGAHNRGRAVRMHAPSHAGRGRLLPAAKAAGDKKHKLTVD